MSSIVCVSARDFISFVYFYFNFPAIFFFFNDTATTEIYTLSLHDALPICVVPLTQNQIVRVVAGNGANWKFVGLGWRNRSEEHTSELQSQSNLVCRLLLEKKKNHLLR